MSKFREFARGSLDVDTVEVEFIDGTKDKVGLRLLLDEQDGQILEQARAAAKRQGVEDPKDGNAIYDRWLAIYRVFLGAVDHEPGHHDEPYFDGVEQIQRFVDGDRIAYLAERQALFQGRRSMRPTGMTKEEFVGHVVHVATAGAGAELPFWQWHPVLRESFLRFTAGLAASSLPPKSPSGSDSA